MREQRLDRIAAAATRALVLADRDVATRMGQLAMRLEPLDGDAAGQVGSRIINNLLELVDLIRDESPEVRERVDAELRRRLR